MKRISTTYIIVLAVSLVFSGELTASTYFASPSGNGNGLSYDSPTSLAAGCKLLQNPGDTLYLLSGQYDLSTFTIQNLNGTSSQRIVISGYEGINKEGSYNTILDFRTTAYGNRGLQINASCTYLHVKNMVLRYSGKNNLYNEGNFNLFENLDIYGSSDTGCQMKGDQYGNKGHDNIILNVDSHDNFDYELDKSGTLTACDFGGNADGFADKQFTANGNHYIGCRAWNNSDDGWDFFQRVSTSQTVIEHCICYANGPASYDMRNHPRYATDKAWFDQFINGKDVIDADGNPVHVTLENYPNMGNGNGFKLGGDGTQHNAIVHHCLSVANTVKGFDQNSDAGALYLYNNTSYDNYSNYGFYNPNGCRLYIQNCISYKPRRKDSMNEEIVHIDDHNSWNTGFEVSDADFESLDENLILAVRQSDGSLPVNGLLRPVDGSLLINSGTNVGLPFYGPAPDLGCYEKFETRPCPSLANAVFHWQMSGVLAPPNDTTLDAIGGTVYVGSRDPAKKVSVENAKYLEGIPVEMQAKDVKALKLSSDALYLILKPASGSFLAGDTIYICGYSPWKISSSLSVMIDSLQTGSDKNSYDYNYMVLPADMDSIVLSRARKNTATGIAAVMVCRDPAITPEVLNDVVTESRMWNLGEEELDDMDTLRAPLAVRQLHLTSTTKSYMVVEACPDKNWEGYTFTRRLRTSGKGTGEGRHLWFGVKGDCTIDVFVASTSSTEGRTLLIATDKFNDVVASLAAPAAQPVMQTFHYSGGITKIYLYGNGGLSIYGIRLTYPDDPTGMEDLNLPGIRTDKILRNGQIYILRNDRIYTLTGEQVSTL